MMILRTKNTKRGFGLIEMVVGISLLSVALVGVGAVAHRSIALSRQSLQETQANFLIEEGAEVMRFFRDSGWENIGNLSTTTAYFLAYGSTWATTTTSTVVDGVFTRTVRVSDVKRDVNDDIASSGTYDSGTKKITMTLSWPDSFGASAKSVEFYLTDI